MLRRSASVIVKRRTPSNYLFHYNRIAAFSDFPKEPINVDTVIADINKNPSLLPQWLGKLHVERKTASIFPFCDEVCVAIKKDSEKWSSDDIISILSSLRDYIEDDGATKILSVLLESSVAKVERKLDAESFLRAVAYLHPFPKYVDPGLNYHIISSAYRRFLDSSSSDIDANRVADVSLVVDAFHKLPRKDYYVPGVASTIELVFRQLNYYREILTPKQVAHAALGLQTYHCTADELDCIINFFADQVDRYRGHFLPTDLANILFGIRMVPAAKPEAERLHYLLGRELLECGHQFRPDDLELCFSALSEKFETRTICHLFSILTERLRTTLFAMKPLCIARCLASFKNISSNKGEVINTMGIFADMIYSKYIVFRGFELGLVFSGLESMNDQSKEITFLLRTLNRHLSYARLSNLHIASILKGLRNMSSENQVVDDILATMATKIYVCSRNFSASDIAACLFGMQSMNSRRLNVSRVLKALAQRLPYCDGTMTDRDITMALTGLQCVRDTYGLTSAFLDALEPFIDGCYEPFSNATIKSIGNLGGFHYRTASVSKFIHTLGKKIGSTGVYQPLLSVNAISAALAGISNFDSGNDSTLTFIAGLAHRLNNVTGQTTASDFSSIIMGMRLWKINEFSPFTSYFLRRVIPILVRCEENLSEKDIQKCLVALNKDKSMDVVEVRQLFDLVATKISLSSASFTSDTSAQVMFGLATLNPSRDEVVSLIKAVAPKVVNSNDKFSLQHLQKIMIGLNNKSLSIPEVPLLLDFVRSRCQSSQLTFSVKEMFSFLPTMKHMDCRHQSVASMFGFLSENIPIIRHSKGVDIDRFIRYLKESYSTTQLKSPAVSQFITVVEQTIASRTPKETEETEEW